MKSKKLLLALIAAALLILTAAPVMAETEDPFDPDVQLERYLQEHPETEKDLKLNDISDDYDFQENADEPGTYTLTITCNNSSSISFRSVSGMYDRYKDKITKVTIENGSMNATEISALSFWDCGCGSLKSVEMPSTVRTIGNGAFLNCCCLNDIDLSNVTSVGVSAFFNCGPNPQNFNFRSSISVALACSYAMFDYIRPDAAEGTTSSSQYMEAYDRMLQILAGLDLDGKSDIEKTKAIYEWVTSNVAYDNEALDYMEYDRDDPAYRRYGYAATIHSALFARQAICQGYSLLLRAMLNESGVDCLYVSGPLTSGDAHAWNLIRIDGSWYLADSTWDAGYVDDSFGIISAKYFLRSSKYFYDDPDSGHSRPDATDVYRSLYKTSDYDYYRKVKSGDYKFMLLEGKAVLTNYTGKATKLTLPQTVDVDGVSIPVTMIGRGAFEQNNRLEKVVIPEGYTYIGGGAFNMCWALTEIVLPSTVEKIGKDAFDELPFLFNVTYNGTIEQYLAIDIGSGNNDLCGNTINCSDGKYDDPHNLENATVKLSQKTFVYDGEDHIPDVTVTMKDGTVLEEDRDYMLRTLYSDTLVPAKKVDFHFIEIVGLGDYSRFSKQVEFRIIPMPTKLKKLRSGKKTLTAYWTKKATQVTGYQMQYALNKKFTKGKKTIRVKGYKNVSKKIKKLKSKKTYYVRVRTYRYVDEGVKEGYLYSSWSNVKKIRVK